VFTNRLDQPINNTGLGAENLSLVKAHCTKCSAELKDMPSVQTKEFGVRRTRVAVLNGVEVQHRLRLGVGRRRNLARHFPHALTPDLPQNKIHPSRLFWS